MNFRQQMAGFHALWKGFFMVTMQTGAFDQIADFKVELVVKIFCHRFYFYLSDCSVLERMGFESTIKIKKKPSHTTASYVAQDIMRFLLTQATPRCLRISDIESF
jgi:hypothetical protein